MNSVVNTRLVQLDIHKRKIAFRMSWDPAFAADQNTFTVLARDGCCEPEVAHVMVRALKSGDCAIDGGANIGFFTLLMAKLVGSSGKVLSIEPGSNNAWKLEQNIRLNPRTNVVILKYPLWSEQRTMPFHLAVDSGENSIMSHDLTVSCTAMLTTTLAGMCGLEQPRLIKLDIEGAEEEALRGGPAITVATTPFIITEVNDWALARFGSSQLSLRAYMRARGYEDFMLHPDGSKPTPMIRGVRHDFGKPNANILFSSQQEVDRAWAR